jgi:hypothetical protein
MIFIVVWLVAIGYTMVYMGVAGFGGRRPSFGEAMGLSSAPATGTTSA